MTSEVAINTINNLSTPVFIMYAFGAAILLLIILKLIGPYLEDIKSFVKGSRRVRETLETAMPSLEHAPWIEKWEFWETKIMDAVIFAESLKSDDPDGSKRKAKVKEIIKKIAKVTGDTTMEQEDILDDVIDMAVASAGLMERTGVKELPFRIK